MDLEQPPEKNGSKHHRREAPEKIQVEVCKDPAGFSGDWSKLYQALAVPHGIQGICAFSRHAFERQLAISGIVVHLAWCGGRLVGAQLFFQQDDVVHCHLGAVVDEGYETGAFYAMDRFAIDYFSGRARKLDLGGGTGFPSDGDDGLSLYKKGWASETRPVCFCGRIASHDQYEALAPPSGGTGYFPAYREGEFG